MRAYLVTVKTAAGPVQFSALARHPVDAMFIAYDRFGLCSVCVRCAP